MSTEARRVRRRTTLSWVLFAVAAVLFAAVVFIYVRNRGDSGQTLPTPPSVAGKAELINVVDALKAQGLKVVLSPQGVRSTDLSVPGQGLTVDGVPLYVFIYPNVASHQEDTTSLDAAGMSLLDSRGTPVAGGPPHLVEGSNVLVALIGGSGDVAAKVDRAIKGLP